MLWHRPWTGESCCEKVLWPVSKDTPHFPVDRGVRVSDWSHSIYPTEWSLYHQSHATEEDEAQGHICLEACAQVQTTSEMNQQTRELPFEFKFKAGAARERE